MSSKSLERIGLCVALLGVFAGKAFAKNPDPVHALLFAPELLMHHRQEIGLTDRQIEQIRTRVETVGPKAQQYQQRMSQAMGQLAELLAADKVDEEAALKQLDEVFAAEKDLKYLHFRLMIQIRNELTAKQRQVAEKLRRTPESAEGLEQRLRAKISRIEEEVHARAEAGQPPFDVVGMMQKFPELMDNGQVQEAEALLDRVIGMLGLNSGNGANQGKPAGLPSRIAAKIQQVQQRAQKMQTNGEDVSEIQKLMNQLAPLMKQGKTEDAEKHIDQALKLTRE